MSLFGAVISHEPQNDLSSYKPSRSTVAECYDSIQADLDAAINSGALPEDKTQGYINLWAAKALQLRVYMTKGEWDNALSVAEGIIANSPYTLWNTSEYAAAWDKNNSVHTNEMIFELLISDNSSSEWTDRKGIAYLYSDPDNNGGYGDLILDCIYTEHRKELVGEGQRYFDVMRRGETVTRYTDTDTNGRGWHDVQTDEARTFNRDSKKALPLTPSSEINANPNMQQNPLY